MTDFDKTYDQILNHAAALGLDMETIRQAKTLFGIAFENGKTSAVMETSQNKADSV